MLRFIARNHRNNVSMTLQIMTCAAVIIQIDDGVGRRINVPMSDVTIHVIDCSVIRAFFFPCVR